MSRTLGRAFATIRDLVLVLVIGAALVFMLAVTLAPLFTDHSPGFGHEGDIVPTASASPFEDEPGFRCEVHGNTACTPDEARLVEQPGITIGPDTIPDGRALLAECREQYDGTELAACVRNAIR